MPEINENMQTPGIDQLQKESRNIFYKEHEFKDDFVNIISILTAMLDESETSVSFIKAGRDEIANALLEHTGGMNDVSTTSDDKIALIVQELVNDVDSAYERIFYKILSDIRLINTNIEHRVSTYDIMASYYNETRNKVFETFGKKSPYKEGLTLNENSKWTIKSPSAVVLRDMDVNDRMITFPIIVNPTISQNTYVKLASFNPVKRQDNKPVFLAEIIISGNLYSFKGYLESADIDRNGKRGALFNAEYGVSYDIPFSFKVVYDNTLNEVDLLFKYDETATEFTSIIKLDFSIHLLVGRNLVIENMNTEFTEALAI